MAGRRMTFADACRAHNITKKYLLRKARLFYTLNPHIKYYEGCDACEYAMSRDGDSAYGCVIRDWRKHPDETHGDCLLKFLPK